MKNYTICTLDDKCWQRVGHAGPCALEENMNNPTPQQPEIIAITRAMLAADNWADEAIDIAQRSRNKDWRDAERPAKVASRCGGAPPWQESQGYNADGTPNLDIFQQADALRYCIEEGHIEDAINHCRELLRKLQATAIIDCDKHLNDCTCPDIEDRLRHLIATGNAFARTAAKRALMERLASKPITREQLKNPTDE